MLADDPQLSLELPTAEIAASDTDREWLLATSRPTQPARARPITLVDIFCGCGGMSLGLVESARRLGFPTDIRLAIDHDPEVAEVYRENLGGNVVAEDVAVAFPGSLGHQLDDVERLIKATVGPLDVLLGGPPCQGNSDLNNHTRRSDPKNALYLRMARAAEVLAPKIVVIENVPPVQWDSGNVVDATRASLESLGYVVDSAVVDCTSAGVPQRRRRFILMASKVRTIDPKLVIANVAGRQRGRRTVRWAIEDLTGSPSAREVDRPSRHSDENQRRIEYLTKRKLLDLPNAERPRCHRDSPTHSYKSMYGRLDWDRPAQTITTGFTSMGQGRFVHPSEPRTLTPHEAARLQTFPDWFGWGEATARTKLSMMIGNAVPPLLGIALTSPIVKLLRPELENKS